MKNSSLVSFFFVVAKSCSKKLKNTVVCFVHLNNYYFICLHLIQLNTLIEKPQQETLYCCFSFVWRVWWKYSKTKSKNTRYLFCPLFYRIHSSFYLSWDRYFISSLFHSNFLICLHSTFFFCLIAFLFFSFFFYSKIQHCISCVCELWGYNKKENRKQSERTKNNTELDWNEMKWILCAWNGIVSNDGNEIKALHIKPQNSRFVQNAKIQSKCCVKRNCTE